MLRIGVLADTHCRDLKRGLTLLEELSERYFSETDLIFHAGDLINPDILLTFSDKVVHAVRGNMDPPDSGLPQRKVIVLNGFRIGLIHGWGKTGDLEERLLREFRGDPIDCLVYGHSHHPACHFKDGVLLFNPGSPIERRRAPFHSVGILELAENIRGRILRIED